MAQPQPQQQQQQPLSLPAITASLIDLISDLQLKNTTMINYYIHPDPVPTEISSYEPRLVLLESRIVKLSKLSYSDCSRLVDNFLPLLASFILPNVSQLAAACDSFQLLFIEHYDRRLETSLPYESIFAKLKYYEHMMGQFIAMQMQRPGPPAERLVPAPSSEIPSLCPGAISFMNGRDKGKVSNVNQADILPYHQRRLTDRGGVILWWECSSCAFRLRYHVDQSIGLNINHTNESLMEDDIDDVSYRSSWLVKCHIYCSKQEAPKPKPKRPKPERRKSSPPPSPMVVPPAAPRPPAPRRYQSDRNPRLPTGMYLLRRFSGGPSQPRYRSPSRSPSPPPRREKEKEKEKEKPKEKTPSPPPPPPEPCGPHRLKYFCPFCISSGLPMRRGTRDSDTEPSSSSSDDSSLFSSSDDDDRAGRAYSHSPPPAKKSTKKKKNKNKPEDKKPAPDVPEVEGTCFRTSEDFIEHLNYVHAGVKNRPVALLLQKFLVAVKGEMARGPDTQRAGGRWDLDLRV